jgi:regulator of replication initiation timing
VHSDLATAQSGSDDDRLKRMQAEKTIALALLLGRMGHMRELTNQLEAARGVVQASKAVGDSAGGVGLEEARERLLAADEVCNTLQGQLVEMEAVMGGLAEENNSLRQELETRRGELGELRAQVKGMLGDLDGLVVENEELRAALTRSTGEKIITQVRSQELFQI